MPQTNAKAPMTLEIDALSFGPYGIGRSGGKATMIPFTAPGDTVEVRIVEHNKRHDVGELIRVLTPSPARQNPPCPYFGTCGGCSWQHLRYDAQLKAKEQSVVDALRRIGKIEDFELRPIIPSSSEYHYRRRIRVQTGANRTLGFHGPASHQVVEIDSCLIADERLNRVLSSLRNWLSGLMTEIESIEIVVGDSREEIVAIAGATDAFAPSDEATCVDLVGGKEICGLVIDGHAWRRAWGETTITVRLQDDLTLAVDADAFTQVNASVNRQMLAEMMAAARFEPSDRVLELYSGAGNFTLPIARSAREVFAVEGKLPAVLNGKLNAQKNGIDNIRWICAPVPKKIAELKQRRERFTKIVLDPPRAGAKGIGADLAAIGAGEIFYISCNPTTLARDLSVLTQHGYKLRLVQPVDFFPQTFHVETLAVMQR